MQLALHVKISIDCMLRNCPVNPDSQEYKIYTAMSLLLAFHCCPSLFPSRMPHRPEPMAGLNTSQKNLYKNSLKDTTTTTVK